MLNERLKAIIGELEREVAEIQQATCPALVRAPEGCSLGESHLSICSPDRPANRRYP
jgi:hypothetical protein